MPIYALKGQRPLAPVLQTAQCNNCVDAGPGSWTSNFNFDTERDARTSWALAGQLLVNQCVPQLWTVIWNNFQCTNANCRNKKACNANVTYMECGSNAVLDPAGNVVWMLYISMTREIMCVPDGPHQDVPPEVPSLERLPPPGSTPPPPPWMPRFPGEFHKGTGGMLSVPAAPADIVDLKPPCPDC
jgi:hypothetical protein